MDQHIAQLNIVVVNYLTKDDVFRLLQEIQDDLGEDASRVQVTVVDNSLNKDGIHDDLRSSYPSVKYIDAGGNVGFGKANTIGFKATPAEYYLTLNPDISFPPERRGVIRSMIRFLETHPRVGCIGPRLLDEDGSLQYSCYRFDVQSILVKPLKHIGLTQRYKRLRTRLARLEMHDFDHDSTRPVDWVQGAAMMVRHEAAADVGWFDERYFMYFEDCDWCLRFWNGGWPVYYVHDIVLTHRHTKGSGQVRGVLRALVQNPLARAHVRSWLRYLWKWRQHHHYYGPWK